MHSGLAVGATYERWFLKIQRWVKPDLLFLRIFLKLERIVFAGCLVPGLMILDVEDGLHLHDVSL